MEEVQSQDVRTSRSRLAGLLRFAGMAVAGVLIMALAVHVVWTRSGSNEWQVVSEKDGVRISTLKTPGESSLRYRARMQVDSRLSDVVAFLSETDTGNDLGAYDIHRIEEVSAAPLFYAYDVYKIRMPPPLGEREVLIINQYHQDPVTRAVSLDIYAAPNKRPLDKDVSRVVHLSNSWTLTPLEHSGVDIVCISEMDLGLPYVLANLAMPKVIDGEFNKIRALLKQDKFKNKKPAFITELHDGVRVTDTR